MSFQTHDGEAHFGASCHDLRDLFAAAVSVRDAKNE
jgi:hypothetical protein